MGIMPTLRAAGTLKFASFIFALGVLLALFLTQNLPFTFGDDLNVIHAAKSVSWGELLAQVANPLTPAWYVHGAESLLTTRAFETTIFKFLHGNFGYSPNAFWTLKALAFGGLGAAVFLFVLGLTGNRWLSSGAAVFFYLLSPVHRSLSWIADPEIIVQMLVGISFVIFFRLYQDRTKGNLQWAGRLVGMILLSWLGIKTKETARIVPFVLAGFLLLRHHAGFPAWVLRNPKHALLALSCFALFIPVIPWKGAAGLALDERSHTAVFQLNPQALLRVIHETAGSVFNLSDKSAPVAPYLLFLAAASLIAVCFARGRGEPEFPRFRDGLVLLAAWLALSTAGFMMNFKIEANVRYLTTLFVPLTIFLFSLLGKTFSLLSKENRTIRRLVFGLGLVLFFWILQRNLDEVISRRVSDNGSAVDIADYVLTKKAYEHRYNVPDASWAELDGFYRGKPPSTGGEFGAIRIKEWDANQKHLAEPAHLAEVAREWGEVYVFSFRDDLYREQPQVRLLFQGTTDNRSVFNAVFKRKKKARRNIYLYYLSRDAAAHIPAATP
jgi:hypothetical protein